MQKCNAGVDGSEIDPKYKQFKMHISLHYTIMARKNWNMGIYFHEGQEIFPKAQPEGIS